jgi:hypothetical protein
MCEVRHILLISKAGGLRKLGRASPICASMVEEVLAVLEEPQLEVYLKYRSAARRARAARSRSARLARMMMVRLFSVKRSMIVLKPIVLP